MTRTSSRNGAGGTGTVERPRLAGMDGPVARCRRLSDGRPAVGHAQRPCGDRRRARERRRRSSLPSRHGPAFAAPRPAAAAYCDRPACGPDQPSAYTPSTVLAMRTGGSTRISASGPGFATTSPTIPSVRIGQDVRLVDGRGIWSGLRDEPAARVRPELRPSEGRAVVRVEGVDAYGRFGSRTRSARAGAGSRSRWRCR